MAPRLLLVEDDERLRRAIRRVLEQEQYRVEEASDGPAGLAAAVSGEFDLVVLDVLLPGLDGFGVCRALRASSVDTPVLMLTALGEVGQRVEGLDAGADDYLAKPFAFDELLARLRALGRRGRGVRQDGSLTHGDLALDLIRHEVRLAGRAVTLTATEFRLLEYLVRNAGRVISRGQILDAVWGYGRDVESNVVDTYVHYLRAKVDTGDGPSVIRTVRGVGYAFGD